MGFYTNCQRVGNFLLLTEFDGEKKFEAIKYRPHLFVPCKEQTKYKTLFGKPVRKKAFPTMKGANYFIYENSDEIGAPPVYGMNRFEYVFLAERYPENIEYDYHKLTVLYIDIEVGSENGFPYPASAAEEITAITIKAVSEDKTKFLVYGCGKYKNERDDVEYKRFKNEQELILQFLDDWEEIGPDIVTGWNVERFDIPYIYNRIVNLFDEETANRLSPWDITEEKMSLSPGKKGDLYREIMGVSTLDYMCLYKKFAEKGKSQEKYSLDHISHEELGERKMSYEEYGSLHKLYRDNYQKFIDYNIRDVELVEKLENHLGLISMVVSVAYDSRVNFYDVFSQVRMWDTMIYNHLRKRNIVVPPKRKLEQEKYPGAFVKEPGPSMYDWVVSFDLDAMYPMIMAQWNISPETLTKVRNEDFPPEKLLSPDSYQENVFNRLLHRELNTKYLEENNVTLSASGYHFSKERRGHIPEILIDGYEIRKKAKNMMKEFKAELAIVRDELKDRGITVDDK